MKYPAYSDYFASILKFCASFIDNFSEVKSFEHVVSIKTHSVTGQYGAISWFSSENTSRYDEVISTGEPSSFCSNGYGLLN